MPPNGGFDRKRWFKGVKVSDNHNSANVRLMHWSQMVWRRVCKYTADRAQIAALLYHDPGRWVRSEREDLTYPVVISLLEGLPQCTDISLCELFRPNDQTPGSVDILLYNLILATAVLCVQAQVEGCGLENDPACVVGGLYQELGNGMMILHRHKRHS